MIGNVILFIGLAVFGGLGTSWYMIEKGSRLTTRTSGPWVTWVAAGRADADPYTRAHFLRRGVLPVSTAMTQTFQSSSDSDGQALYSSCDYQIEGPEPLAGFWSIAVFTEQGAVIQNPADRYSFNSATIMRPPLGGIDIRLARSARPGNWLPTGGGGRITLTMTVDEFKAAGADPDRLPQLPAIRRLACR